MKLQSLTTPIREALSTRSAAPGTVKFETSQFTDPHIQKAIAHIAAKVGKTPEEVTKALQIQVLMAAKTAQKAPSLHETMQRNAVESKVFSALWKSVPEDDVVDIAFSERVFIQLVRFIKADHTDFFPLKGFIDRRALLTEEWVIIPSSNPAYAKYNNAIDTAAATPSGTFLFNRVFMQKLLDYASLKGLKGNGNKYKSNGGPIPDQYAYIEFLILHELMHYSNDDFYYQHIIPNANPTIINWVGDFRSNYLLVKSGYAQLPIGLYNDMINYDRQSEYIQMYRIVEEEMAKLSEKDKQEVEDQMDEMSDDHEPGQDEGKSDKNAANKAAGKTASDIDDNAERVNDDIADSKDSSEPAEAGDGKDEGSSEISRGEGGKAEQQIDYTKVTPSFNWQQLVKRFISSASPRTFETYSKPNKRSATAADLIRQTGAGAIKPAEKLSDHVDISLMFVVDSSGSMSTAIAKAYATIATLLRQPQFKKSDCLVVRFSTNYDIHKGNFSKNQAAKITSITDKPSSYNTTLQSVFNSHMGYGTAFEGQLIEQITAAIKLKYNVLIFSDSDIFHGKNLENLNKVIAANPRAVFVLFDKRETYVQWRSIPGAVVTPNISHL